MVKYCPNCGRPNPDNARFCAYCGYDLSAILSAGTHRAQVAQTYQAAYYRRPTYIEFEYPSWLRYIALVAGIITGVGFILGGVLLIATLGSLLAIFGASHFAVISGVGVILLGISALLSGIIFNSRLVSIFLMLYGILIGVSLIVIHLTVEGVMYILFGLFALLAGIFSGLQTKAGYIVSSVMTYLSAIFFLIGAYKISFLGRDADIIVSYFTVGSNYILAFIAMLVLATAVILYGVLQNATGKFITYLMLSIAGIMVGIGVLLPNIGVLSEMGRLGSYAFSTWQSTLMMVGSIMLTIGGIMAMIYSILGLVYTIMSYTRGY